MFLTLAIVLVAALAVGFALKGRISSLAEIRFKALAVLPVSLAIGLVPLFVAMPSGASRALTAAANAGVLAFLALNIASHTGAVRAGLAVLLAGWALNAIVIAANGGMPLSAWAWHSVLHHTEPITQGKGGFFKVIVATPKTVLRPLGDVIPIPPIREVLSLGDLLLVLGIGVVVAAGMRAPQPEPAIAP